MSLVYGYRKDPNLLDIPLYRQKLSRDRDDSAGLDTDLITDNDSSFKLRNQMFGSATEALEEYIREFDRQPSDTILAIHYGNTLEHIPVHLPKPEPAVRERSYLPSVTDLLASTARNVTLTPSEVTSPPKSILSRSSSPDKSRLSHSPTKSPVKGIFWDISGPSRPKDPDLSLSPIKPSPFDKLVDLTLKPLSDVTTMPMNAKRDVILTREPVSPHKPSPYEKLVDLNASPLDGLDFDLDCDSVLKKYDMKSRMEKFSGHRVPSWIEDIVDSSTTSSAKENVPEWVMELEQAESADVVGLIQKRFGEYEDGKLVNPNDDSDVGDAVMDVNVEGDRRERPSTRRRARDTEDSVRLTAVRSAKTRTKSEDRVRHCTEGHLKERSSSRASLDGANTEEKIDFSSVTDQLVAEVLGRYGPEAVGGNPLPSDPLDSVSCSDNKPARVSRGRPMEKLKNMLFTVQNLDSENEKEPSVLEDRELARLAEDSEPLRKALEHLSNVRDIIHSSPIKSGEAGTNDDS